MSTRWSPESDPFDLGRFETPRPGRPVNGTAGVGATIYPDGSGEIRAREKEMRSRLVHLSTELA